MNKPRYSRAGQRVWVVIHYEGYGHIIESSEIKSVHSSKEAAEKANVNPLDTVEERIENRNGDYLP